jgi:DNA-directed RNA polymerase subunit M/transcription elongation factor TFIIS
LICPNCGRVMEASRAKAGADLGDCQHCGAHVPLRRVKSVIDSLRRI